MFYEIRIEKDQTDDGTPCWLVTVPAFPEIATSVDDEKHASAQAIWAIREVMDARIADGMEVPRPRKDRPAGPFVQL